MTDNPLPRRKRPCGECPYRRDVEPGMFSAERFEDLRETAIDIAPETVEDIFSQPMFACHMTDEGKEVACAGWLAVSGENHIGVRVAVSQGRLPEEALRPQPGWPSLFADYDEMAERQGRRDTKGEHERLGLDHPASCSSRRWCPGSEA